MKNHPMGIRAAALLLAAALLTGCAAPAVPAAPAETAETAAQPAAAETEKTLASLRALGAAPDDDYRNWYEIFVYSFCDSNGDGVGDLKGVESKLDELQTLGITGIWLMPVSPSPSYHKYDVTDYCAIDPQYGTLDDFDSLLAACHRRGIRVITDLVVNHTSSAHPWFTAAASYLKTLPAGAQPDPAACPTVAYYHFVPAAEAKSGYAKLAGTDWAYECPFSDAMPDLNWDSDAVHAEIEKVMAFWLARGVDGFRLDAAKEYYSGSEEKNRAVLSWLEATAKAHEPNAYLVAEVWDTFGAITGYYQSGITSIFDYPFGNADGKIIKTLRGAGRESVVQTYAQSLEKAEAAYRQANPSFIDAPFLSNHDTGRIYGFVGGDEAKLKLAGAMNLMMSGSVFVYYGEELGMPGSGNDPSKRAPMLWAAAGTPDTPAPPPGCTVQQAPFGGLAEQRGQDGSIYNYYRQLLALRKALPAIARGRTTAETPLNRGTVSAVRKTTDAQQCLILFNIGTDAAAVDLSAYAGWRLAAGLSADQNAVTLAGNTLTLPGCGMAVLLAETAGEAAS